MINGAPRDIASVKGLARRVVNSYNLLQPLSVQMHGTLIASYNNGRRSLLNSPANAYISRQQISPFINSDFTQCRSTIRLSSESVGFSVALTWQRCGRTDIITSIHAMLGTQASVRTAISFRRAERSSFSNSVSVNCVGVRSRVTDDCTSPSARSTVADRIQ